MTFKTKNSNFENENKKIKNLRMKINKSFAQFVKLKELTQIQPAYKQCFAKYG